MDIDIILAPDLTPDEMTEPGLLAECNAAGFDEMALWVHDDRAFAIKTICERVIPALRQVNQH